MNFSQWLFQEETQRVFDFMRVPEVGWADVRDRKLFGPVYHGTTEDNRRKIDQQGFQVFVGDARTGGVLNGYELQNYHDNIPAPIHHLGFGVYFTTSKTIAKKYNGGTTKGLTEFYLEVPRLETINFGAYKTMMQWWRKNGYDMPPVSDWSDKERIAQQRLQATINLTNTLKSKYDAVWFKGRGLNRLLDGDQICVFDPTRIYRLNPDKGGANENNIGTGDRIVIKGTRIVTKVTSVREAMKTDWDEIVGPSKYQLSVAGDFGDPNGEMQQVYGARLREALKKNYADMIGERAKEEGKTFDEFLDWFVQKRFEHLRYNLPSALVERKLKKGERFK